MRITIDERILTLFVLLVGLGIVAIPTGTVASALKQARQELASESKDREETVSPDS